MKQHTTGVVEQEGAQQKGLLESTTGRAQIQGD
jgi:hypothetical protein